MASLRLNLHNLDLSSGTFVAFVTFCKMDLWTAFVLGLVGSLHCAGMCGPLALALPTTGATAPGFVAGRIAYNIGRVITYCGLGPIPMMLGIGLSGRSVPLWWRLQLRKVVPVSVFLLACLLILRGMALGIPYLSPDLSTGSASCCQK